MHTFLLENLKVRNNLWDLGSDGRTALLIDGNNWINSTVVFFRNNAVSLPALSAEGRQVKLAIWVRAVCVITSQTNVWLFNCFYILACQVTWIDRVVSNYLTFCVIDVYLIYILMLNHLSHISSTCSFIRFLNYMRNYCQWFESSNKPIIALMNLLSTVNFAV
jgi:hypothetical protein